VKSAAITSSQLSYLDLNTCDSVPSVTLIIFEWPGRDGSKSSSSKWEENGGTNVPWASRELSGRNDAQWPLQSCIRSKWGSELKQTDQLMVLGLPTRIF
jgi:hypothetical protein